MTSDAVKLLVVGITRRICLRDAIEEELPCISAPDNRPPIKVMRVDEANTINSIDHLIGLGIRIDLCP